MFKLVQEKLVFCGFPKSHYYCPVVIKLFYSRFLIFISKINFKTRCLKVTGVLGIACNEVEFNYFSDI